MHRHATSAVFVIALLTLPLLCCGGGDEPIAGDDAPPDDPFEGVAATLSPDGRSAIAADNELLMSATTEHVTIKTLAGEEADLQLGPDGLPVQLVSGGLVIRYDNWNETTGTVDLGWVLPNGAKRVVVDVPVDPTALAELKGLASQKPEFLPASPGGPGGPAYYSLADVLWLLKLGAKAWEVVGCATAISAAMGSGGITLPAVFLACESLLVDLLVRTGLIEENNDLIVARENLLETMAVVDCIQGDIEACVEEIVQLVTEILEEVQDVTEEQRELIDEIVEELDRDPYLVYFEEFENELSEWNSAPAPYMVLDTTNSQLRWGTDDVLRSVQDPFTSTALEVGDTIAIDTQFWTMNDPTAYQSLHFGLSDGLGVPANGQWPATFIGFWTEYSPGDALAATHIGIRKGPGEELWPALFHPASDPLRIYLQLTIVSDTWCHVYATTDDPGQTFIDFGFPMSMVGVQLDRCALWNMVDHLNGVTGVHFEGWVNSVQWYRSGP